MNNVLEIIASITRKGFNMLTGKAKTNEHRRTIAILKVTQGYLDEEIKKTDIAKTINGALHGTKSNR